MTSRSFTVLAALFLVLESAAGAGCGGGDSGPKPAPVVPRPDGGRREAGPVSYCSDGEDCKAAESCQANCGMHELGDRSCTCNVDGTYDCTDCVLNASFMGKLTDPTTFCDLDEVYSSDTCPAAGATCVVVEFYDETAPPYRGGCLCWMGRDGLEWGCDDTFNFFVDKAGPAVPPDGGVDPVGVPTTPADAAAD